MSIFRRKRKAPPPAVEHAVLVHFSLGDEDLGSDGERQAVFELEDRLDQLLASARTGELDGNEFGGGEAVLYLYGPDKDRLWQTIEPAIRDFPLRPAHALLRPGGPEVGAQRIDL